MKHYWDMYWDVDGEAFYNKRDALIYASKNNIHISKIRFHYFHNVWNNFDRSLLGKSDLDDLYKDRAIQLRDTYDYLILYYSGGADSHNVLMTFINNNIPLDEICVKWPKALSDNKFYIPNNIDKSARNYWSEWDFAIKPSLQWISKNYPKIKITIKDYVASPDKIKIGPLFEKMNFIRPGGMLLNSIVSDSEKNIKFQKIAHIYGIDKPLIASENDKFYMFFYDMHLDQAVHSDLNPDGTECFYWTKNMPLLAFEAANKLVSFVKNNPSLLNTHIIRPNMKINELFISIQLQNDLAKILLYKTWDNKFQADKPKTANRTDKFFWFYEHSEFETMRKMHNFEVLSRTDNISNDFLIGNTSDIPVYKPIRSPGYIIS